MTPVTFKTIDNKVYSLCEMDNIPDRVLRYDEGIEHRRTEISGLEQEITDIEIQKAALTLLASEIQV